MICLWASDEKSDLGGIRTLLGNPNVKPFT